MDRNHSSSKCAHSVKASSPSRKPSTTLIDKWLHGERLTSSTAAAISPGLARLPQLSARLDAGETARLDVGRPVPSLEGTMDLINPEILVEFHLAKLHRAGSYKGCVVVYPEPNAAAYDMYRISPILPHETARKAVNRRHRALKPNRKFPFGGKNKTVNGPKDTKSPVPDAENTKMLVPENIEPATISDESIDAYHTRRLDAKVAALVKEE